MVVEIDARVLLNVLCPDSSSGCRDRGLDRHMDIQLEVMAFRSFHSGDLRCSNQAPEYSNLVRRLCTNHIT